MPFSGCFEPTTSCPRPAPKSRSRPLNPPLLIWFPPDSHCDNAEGGCGAKNITGVDT